MEDCRHVTRGLERDLLAAGFEVVRVPTHLMAAARRGGREKGKSDPIDALAVAHAALREPDLPTGRLDGPAREVKLLSDYRHVLVTERTELINQLRWHLHELDPGLGFRLVGCAATASLTTSPNASPASTGWSPSSRER
nr:transposase [Nocardia anaemiae]